MNNPCVAHRGWSSRAPENTMAAIRLALDDPNVEWIEIDVHLSKDHVPVVIHDYTLRRTTNGKGDVKSLSAAQITALDAGNWFSQKYQGEPVPTLAHVLKEAVGRCKLNIELKTDGIRYPMIEQKVLECIEAYDAVKEVVITSFHEGTLYRMKRICGEIRTGLIIDGWRNTLPKELKELGADFLSISYTKLNKDRVELMKQAGIQVMAWTINEKRAMRKIAALDPELMICTNYPERWHEVRV
ncbi:glycerophosphodiester phosphodiesterase family protein [Paenibacillus sp. LHD-38]|uniref:glycerophosphodiester phosphodiesterase n=1 Tax=Paenibacillus sp. LHD-38 TaxID=3072143 RepID=UPI00280E0FC1|nr:glycerophosphodiester phosphodiesterase family protein [Paenibacillus sp. LHD-38]MDQ8736264.1 glycerophosphodiester phosphodiesterase family protein [Paenibacillus sp. LHD-38]